MTAEIQEAGTADLPLLAALHRRCFPREAWDENSLLGILGLPGGVGLIAKDEEGDAAGFVLAILVVDLCDVATVCVLSERRRRGIARALIEALAGVARRKGATEMTLEVGEKNNAARRLYEGLGFAVDERWEENGVLQGVMLRAGDYMLGLSQDDWKKGRDRQKGIGMRVHIGTTQNVDDLAARATAAGVSLDTEPYNTPWNSRAFDVTDPSGFKLSVSTEVVGV